MIVAGRPPVFRGSNLFAHLRPTTVFDSYWRFAVERQAIFFRRLAGMPAPWTDDPILAGYRFTNAYRAADRVSQFLIREVIYGDGRSQSPRETLFRVMLFRLFNKIQTWQLLEQRLGKLAWDDFDFKAYDRVLSNAMAHGTKLYSAAYIIPPVTRSGVKHRGHLQLVQAALNGDFTDELAQAKSLEQVFMLLKQLPSFGNFLAFQLAIDLNYSTVIDFPEDSFVVAGPGARDGIAKCFENAADFSAEDIIGFVHNQQDSEFVRLGLTFQSLWGRPLQLIDCQNLFCEIGKYARVAHPDVAGISGRARIKQVFRPDETALTVWFPPKWGLNDRLPEQQPHPVQRTTR
ncbi:MAG: nucleotide kinase domain-containing protein [Stellaceae bacterium]